MNCSVSVGVAVSALGVEVDAATLHFLQKRGLEIASM